MKQEIECPHCGTEVAPDGCDCHEQSASVGEQTGIALHDCPRCQGTGVTKYYYCSHCGWQHEE